MPFLSKLRPDSATEVGVLTAIGVYLIYQNSLPSIADVRNADSDNGDIESSRKSAAWKSALLISAVFLVARDLNSYIISGAALVGIDYMYKHHNMVNPGTGKLDTNAMGSAPGSAQVYPMPNYGS